MINVDVVSKSDGYMSIEIKGHADPKICAIVSALNQASVRYMQELAEQVPNELRVNVREVE